MQTAHFYFLHPTQYSLHLICVHSLNLGECTCLHFESGKERVTFCVFAGVVSGNIILVVSLLFRLSLCWKFVLLRQMTCHLNVFSSRLLLRPSVYARELFPHVYWKGSLEGVLKKSYRTWLGTGQGWGDSPAKLGCRLHDALYCSRLYGLLYVGIVVLGKTAIVKRARKKEKRLSTRGQDRKSVV